MELRATIAERSDGTFEAQLLELDIATSANSVDDLVPAIAHAICSEYQIAIENDEVPFISIPEAPESFDRLWRSLAAETPPEQAETMSLPQEVLNALAICLRADKPQFTVSEVKRAA